MVQTKWEFRWSNLPHPGNYASQWGRTHILFGYFVALLIIKKINLNASNPDNQCGQWTFTPTTHTHACQTEPMQFAEEPLSIAQQRPIIFSSLFFFLLLVCPMIFGCPQQRVEVQVCTKHQQVTHTTQCRSSAPTGTIRPTDSIREIGIYIINTKSLNRIKINIPVCIAYEWDFFSGEWMF